MPQTFQVLRCYKCLVFQVHQTKKSIKWECKLCGEKQSIKRHYGIGTGRDCRLHVQKLNNIRGEIDEYKCSQMRRNAESDEESEAHTLEPQPLASQPKQTNNSKWTNYVEEVDVITETSEDSMCLGDTEVVLEIPKKRRKQFHNKKTNFYTKAQTASSNSSVLQNSYSDNKRKYEPISYNIPEHASIVKNIPEAKVFPSNGIPKIEKENTQQNIPRKKFIPPVIDKSSKWAQFADNDEEPNVPSQSLESSQTDGLFSLCDDSDIDNVLDIL